MKYSFIFLFFLFFATACGQYGKLYLPDVPKSSNSLNNNQVTTPSQ